MTLLSCIAIIAVALIGLSKHLFTREVYQKEKPVSSKWKSVFWEIGQWFDFQNMPTGWKFFLKFSHSALYPIAFGCGFWEAYHMVSLTDGPIIPRILVSFGTSLLSFFFLYFLFAVFIVKFKKFITDDYFSLKTKPYLVTIINILILCTIIGISILVLWSSTWSLEHLYVYLGLAELISFVLSLLFLLAIVVLWKIIYLLGEFFRLNILFLYRKTKDMISNYIKWLQN